MSSQNLANILSSSNFYGSWDYFWNDGWKVAVPFYFFAYFIIVGTELKVVMQYFLWSYTSLRLNHSLWLPIDLIAAPSFFLLLNCIPYKPLAVYVVIPAVVIIFLSIGETFLEKGIKKFDWNRSSIV